MSTELGTIADLNVTAFCGGERGPCLQFTPTQECGHSYSQLNRSDVSELLRVLLGWLLNSYRSELKKEKS